MKKISLLVFVLLFSSSSCSFIRLSEKNNNELSKYKRDIKLFSAWEGCKPLIIKSFENVTNLSINADQYNLTDGNRIDYIALIPYLVANKKKYYIVRKKDSNKLFLLSHQPPDRFFRNSLNRMKPPKSNSFSDWLPSLSTQSSNSYVVDNPSKFLNHHKKIHLKTHSDILFSLETKTGSPLKIKNHEELLKALLFFKMSMNKDDNTKNTLKTEPVYIIVSYLTSKVYSDSYDQPKLESTEDQPIVDMNQEYPIIPVQSPSIPYFYRYVVQFYETENGCRLSNSVPVKYFFYTANGLKEGVAKPSYWAKVVYGDINKSFCIQGTVVNESLQYEFKPNIFNEKRILIIIANSKGVEQEFFAKRIWTYFTNNLIEWYKEKRPVTILTLLQSGYLDLVIQAEDLASFFKTPEDISAKVEKRLRSKINLAGNIVNPMLELDTIYDMYQDKIEKIIYIVDAKNVHPDEKLTPRHLMMPLYWQNQSIPFFVVTSNHCQVWNNASVSRCFEKNDLSIINRLVRNDKFH